MTEKASTEYDPRFDGGSPFRICAACGDRIAIEQQWVCPCTVNGYFCWCCFHSPKHERDCKYYREWKENKEESVR